MVSPLVAEGDRSPSSPSRRRSSGTTWSRRKLRSLEDFGEFHTALAEREFKDHLFDLLFRCLEAQGCKLDRRSTKEILLSELDEWTEAARREADRAS